MIPTTVVRLEDRALDEFVGRRLSLFTTLEGENPGGSIKDHMVSGELDWLFSNGALKPEVTITEASAGSTALSLAYYTHLKKVRCILYVLDTHPIQSVERLRSLGAEVRFVKREDDWKPFYSFCKEPGVLPFDQSLDAKKRRHYVELGKRIAAETGPLEAIIGAVGTAHSLLGVTEGLECSPYLVTAEPRTEKISGIRNIGTLRYGEGGREDPCTPDLFDERVLLDASEFFTGDSLMTDQGPISFCDSFRVCLGGLARLVRSGPQMKSCFVLGSTNRR